MSYPKSLYLKKAEARELADSMVPAPTMALIPTTIKVGEKYYKYAMYCRTTFGTILYHYLLTEYDTAGNPRSSA